MLLQLLALVAGGIVFLGPMNLKQSGSSPKATTLRVLHRQQTVPPVSLWKRTDDLSWSFSLKGTLQVYHSSRGYRSALKEHRLGEPSLHSLSPLLQFTSTYQKGAHTLNWSPDFCNCSQRDTFRWPGLEASRAHNCSPTGQYIFAYLKSCCLKVWLLISLKVGADWGLPLWNTHRSWHTLSTWDLSRINQAA